MSFMPFIHHLIYILLNLTYIRWSAGSVTADYKLKTSVEDVRGRFIFEPGETADFQVKKNLSVIAFGSCR